MDKAGSELARFGFWDLCPKGRRFRVEVRQGQGRSEIVQSLVRQEPEVLYPPFR